MSAIRQWVVGVCTFVMLVVSTGMAFAHKAGDSCTRRGATTRISGVKYTCVKDTRDNLVWRVVVIQTPPVSSTTSLAPTPTTVATSPSVSLAATTIQSTVEPQIVTVTSNVSGTVYFIEGATPVSSVSDITSSHISRWAKGSVLTAHVPTQITLDVANLTNGYYRVFIVNSAGVLSAPASNIVTISITRIAETVSSLSCADGGACAIGDIGPGGGVVFILATTSGNTTGKTFEAARKDWDGGSQDGTAMWCGASSSSIAGLGTAIGTGSSNSATLASTCTSTGTSDAAEYVRGKTIGGKSDWFLPSRDEALEIYTQRSVFTGIYAINTTNVDTARYLTSSEGTTFTGNAVGAYLQGSVSPGNAQEVSKSFGFSVRPVRSFVSG